MGYPLSLQQERLYFMQKSAPESRAFNLAVVLHLSSLRGETISTECLNSALRSIVERHSVLRTTVHEVVIGSSVSLVQRVHPPDTFEDCNIQAVSEDSDVLALIRDEMFKPFNLTEHQFRFTIFVLSPEKLILCMSFHHIVMDGASLHIAVQEVQRIVSGGKQESSPQPPQFVDLVEKVDREDSARLQRWIDMLESAECCTTFGQPCHSRIGHTVQYYLNTQQYLQVTEKALSAMKAARANNVSPVVLLAAAFAIALCRYTGTRDIVFGMLSMNRNRQYGNVIGCLANALPLRVDFNKSQTLDDLFKQVRRNCGLILDGGIDLVELLSHIPCLQGGHTPPGASPLQVFFSYYNVGQEKLSQILELEGGVEVTCDIQVPKPEHTHADLFFEASKNREDLFYWESRKLVLSVSNVHTLHGLMCQAIEELAAQNFTGPFKVACTIKPSAVEYSVAVGKDMFGSTFPDSHLFYIERFEKKAMEIPDCAAFKHSGVTLTYHEASVTMGRISALLWERGIRPGDHVAVYLTRTPQLYLSILGVLKCGATYVPIALQNTPQRIARILKHADAKFLITEESLLQTVPGDWTDKTLCIHPNCRALLTDSTTTPPEVTYHSDQLFYIIFTSGTTGEPKGVAITNGNMRVTLNNFQKLLTPDDTRVTLASLNVAFDAHVQDSLAPLLNGACVVVAKDITEIPQGVTYAAAAVSAASVVEFPSSMCVLGVGGEALTQQCYEKTKKIPKVINFYGPTECTVFATANIVTGSEQDISNIGKPLPDVTVMVLDESKQLVPVSHPGTLYIGGPVVSSVGYYNNPEQTEKVFITNPLDPSETIYCTGDHVRMLPDGCLQFLGRTDDQVKLRGMRFQILEVEQTLASCQNVLAAAVFVRNQATPSAQLIACVTPKSVSSQAVLQYVSCHLPSYMVPSVVVTLDKFPLTKEGKVDRKTLSNIPLKACVNSEGQPPNQQPSEITLKLAAIFGHVLGIEDFPPNADFFMSGGHSLLIFQLVSLVNQQLHCNINISHILQNTTPMSLADAITSTLHQPGRTNPCIPPQTLVYYHSEDVLQSHLKLKAKLEFQRTSEEPTEVLYPPNSPEELPVFFIHAGVIGWSLPYIKLAQSLGRYSIAIQRTPDTPTSSLQDMSAYFVRAITSTQPCGPYRLVGLCFGVFLVYEISKQLLDAGERVELTVFIGNSPAHENHPNVFNQVGQPLPNTAAHPVHFFQQALKLSFPPEVLRLNKEDVNLEDLAATILTTYRWLPFNLTDLKDAYLWFFSYIRCCLDGYSPQPCPTIENCLLIRSKEHQLFTSHDYGLLQLTNPDSLSVITAPREIDVGELSASKTLDFITSVIELYTDK